MLELPQAISPFYQTPEMNAVIELYSGSLELEAKDATIHGTGGIVLNWLPVPRLRFSVDTDQLERPASLSSAKLKLLGVDQTPVLDVDITSQKFAFSRGTSTLGGLVHQVAIGKEPFHSLVFHLANFHDDSGEPIQSEDGAWAGRAAIKADDWLIDIDRLFDAKSELFKSLNANAGFAITHAGRISRTDKEAFRLSDVDSLREALFWFLSFCRGRWTGPMMLVGLDGSGRKVWEQWTNTKIVRATNVNSWYFTQKSAGISDAFAGFWKLWCNELWQDPLELAVYWYVEANMCAGGVEGALILAQAALEVIAWTCLVEEKKAISSDGFQKLTAADQLSLLFESCGVANSLPDGVPELRAAAGEYNWTSSSLALTEMRNAFVHANPKRRKRVFAKDAMLRHEAWNVALWYLDLVLLRLCDFSGIYADRLVKDGYYISCAKTVPWAKTST